MKFLGIIVLLVVGSFLFYIYADLASGQTIQQSLQHCLSLFQGPNTSEMILIYLFLIYSLIQFLYFAFVKKI